MIQTSTVIYRREPLWLISRVNIFSGLRHVIPTEKSAFDHKNSVHLKLARWSAQGQKVHFKEVTKNERRNQTTTLVTSVKRFYLLTCVGHNMHLILLTSYYLKKGSPEFGCFHSQDKVNKLPPYPSPMLFQIPSKPFHPWTPLDSQCLPSTAPIIRV